MANSEHDKRNAWSAYSTPARYIPAKCVHSQSELLNTMNEEVGKGRFRVEVSVKLES
jgi:hypothetical protein